MHTRSQAGRFRGWSVGLYLFSVPIFSYSPELNLGVVPQLLGLLVVLHAILDIIASKELHVGRDIQCYGMFAIWAVVTYLLSDPKGNPYDVGTLGTMVKVAVVTIAAAQVMRTKKDFLVALAIYNSSILVVSYLNYDLIQDLRNTLYVRGDDRFAGTLVNANTAAMYALSVVWSSITLYFCSEVQRLIKIMSLLTAPLAIWIVGFSGSRKGLLGIVVFSAMASWWIIKRHRKSIVKFAAAIIVSGILLAGSAYYVYRSPFFFRLERLLTDDNTESSPNKRLYLVVTATRVWIDDFKTFLLGVGYDNFRFYNQLQTYSHSTISETLVCTGIVGFGFYFGGLYILSRRLFSLKRHTFLGWMGMSFVVLFVFLSINAVLCASREFWPLTAMISSYSLINSSRYVQVGPALMARVPAKVIGK